MVVQHYKLAVVSDKVAADTQTLAYNEDTNLWDPAAPDSGTSVSGTVATAADLPAPQQGKSFIVQDEVALYVAHDGAWTGPFPVEGQATDAAVAAQVTSGAATPAAVGEVARTYARPVDSMTAYPGATPAARLQAAITAVGADGGGDVMIPEAFTIGPGEEIEVPPGVRLLSRGKTRSKITYTGTGWAVTFRGVINTDYRRGGGCDPLAIVLATEGGKGLRLIDCRDVQVDVAVNGANGGTTTRLGDVGVGVYYEAFNIGSSWNIVRVRNDYCKVGLELDGTAHTPSWVTRNEFYGHVQSCNTGVRMAGANTNKLEVHPQACTLAWSLTNSDTNDIYTVCENNTTDWDADNASQNNRVRGSIGATGAIAGQGTNTSWLTTRRTALPAIGSPWEWDAAGGPFIERPAAGQGATARREFWTRSDTDALLRAMYLETGSADPRLVMDRAIRLGASTLPTAVAFRRGELRRVEGAAGVADGVYVCVKNAANAYEWKQIA